MILFSGLENISFSSQAMPSQKTSLFGEDNPDNVELTLLAFQQTQIDDKVAVLGNRIKVLDNLLRTGDYQEQNPHDVPTLIFSYNRGWNHYINKRIDFNLFLSGLGFIDQYWLIYNSSPPANIN